MKIKITPHAQVVINNIGNSTLKNSAIKIWAGLYRMSSRKNKHGFFDCPSSYLESINSRYSKIIKVFIEEGLIEYYKTIHPDQTDIFKTTEKKYYDTKRGICMKYRFLVDFTDATEVEVEMDNFRKYRWYQVIENSLKQLGYEVKISRDSFGQRVHHPVIPVYKTELKDRGFAVIDAVASQPKLVYLMMKNQGIVDDNFNEAFEKDFYDYVVKKLDLDNRKMAKDLFMYWLNSSGYVPNYKIHLLFPIASKFIKSLKTKNYKDSSAYLQRQESKIWIDDLLNNIPVDFALPIHDSFIVKDKDGYEVLEYCKTRYPDVDFKLEFL